MKESKTYVNHKDTIFCLLYRDKDNLLDLYNGMNGTSYSDTENLMVTTLKNGIYVKYKNDASFVFSQDLYMFEKKNKETQIECGMTELGVGDINDRINAVNSLELIVQVLNINSGNNSELLEKCKSLKDYMIFVNKVRQKKNEEKKDIEIAVNEAIDECIQENVLSDFFRKNRREVVGVSIYEYDEEGHMEVLKEEQYQRGVEDGIQQGINEGIKEGIKEGEHKERVRAITSMLELGIDKEKILTKYSEEEYEMAVKDKKK